MTAVFMRQRASTALSPVILFRPIAYPPTAVLLSMLLITGVIIGVTRPVVNQAL
ncbi:hypothetical protein [Shewanella sp.]|uniref:hypothetical protein n=1 Tax=Shewanella sp. TaxID=50422 RepID=UPI003F3C73AF